MKLLMKKFSYRILVISMITVILSFFSVSSISEAKLKLEEGQFYYTGTQDATYTPKANLVDRLIKALGEVANYLLGLVTLGIRGVIIGWFAIAELILSMLLNPEADAINDDGLIPYTQNIVNIQSIIFNKVPILDANIYKDFSKVNGSKSDLENIVVIIKNSAAKWYYIMRLIVIAFMLLLLIFIGIKMALSTIASEKAVYKQMLVDWLAGMIIVFSVHYIMVFILTVNDSIVSSLENLTKNPVEIREEYQYGEEKEDELETKDLEMSLYESARTRAYDVKLTNGFTGMIIYGVLVYYAWRFALIYFRRLINIIILTLTAPVVSASYAFNKVLLGKAKIFSTWLSEFVMNVIIQIVHIVIYVTFVSVALQLSLVSLPGTVLAFELLKFMTQADKILRQLFKLSGGKGSLAGDMSDRTGFKEMRSEMRGLKEAMVGGTLTKAAMKATYGAVTKPIKSAGMVALGTTVAAVQNTEHFKEHQRKKKENDFKKQEEAANEYLANNEEAIEKTQQIEKLEQQKKKLFKEREQLKAQYGLSSKQEKLDENKAEIRKINKEMEKLEEEIQKGFLTQQIENGGSIMGTLKGNLGKALTGLTYKDEQTRKV